MGLLQKLKDTRITKQNYFVLQHRIYAELSKKFPHIMNSNMAIIVNKFEEELQTLLCAALKYKSIKIPISAKGHYNNTEKTIVNVERNVPGFFYPYSHRGSSDIHYMDINNHINDNDDMYRKSMDKKEKSYLRVALSELKTDKKKVLQSKLDIYFKFLREVMAYRKNFLCYVMSSEKRKFIINDLNFNLPAKSINVYFIKDKNESNYFYNNSNHFKYHKDSCDILHLLDYSNDEDYNDNSFNAEIHNKLKSFIHNYEKIYNRFKLEEIKKRKVYKTCSEILKQMRKHTLPFKVFNKLIKK